jgi:imidazolonepropionase-like amidohydrolase
MLRHVVVSPDGSEVLYSALGRLYRKTLPDGDPARFSRDERIELAPSYSRDGQWVVYATWSDGDKGRIRIAGRDGSSARDLVSVRGHYTEPSFSPDGRKVVYRRVEGDDVRGEENSTDPGIYLVDSAGSEPRLIRTSGSEPRFDSSGERIYFRERRGEKVVLASVDLDGAKERIHFESENATSIVPSPDDGFVAFAERFKIFVAPFPKTGRPVTLGPGVKAFPVVEVSKEAGLYLHWSGDGRKLHWSLGPELFTVSRDAAFGAEFETERIPIGFRIASDLPTGTIALVGARVLTMAGSEQDSVLENATIVIEKNRIAAVGPSGSTKVPPGATRVDVSGRTIVPGLIDVHAHLGSESAGVLSEQSWPLVANLAYGVTTSHDPSNNTEMVFTNSEMIRAGAKLGPRLYSTGMILYGAETPFKADIQTYEDALSHLRRMKAVGAFTVKSYNQQRRDVRQMIVKAARELEMMVVPEGGSLLYMDETFVYDGHTGLEHSLPVPALYQDVATLFGKSATGYTPTLIVGFGGLSGEYYWYQHDEVWQNERLLDFVPREVVDARARRRTMAPEDDFHHVQIAEGAKKILDAGGKVQLGAHGQLQGLGVHWELWMLAQGGMTPFQALRAATLSGAEYIGLDAELGSIQVGKLADLVVLAGNPLENIRSSESVLQVMVNGRLYDAATMNEVGNHPRVRPPFYWQVPD